jgi:hypothetical protein
MEIKKRVLNMALQAGRIKSMFPGSLLVYNQDHLIWKHNLIPSPLSSTYEINLHYDRSQQPNVYVFSPRLRLHKSSDRLPHVYDHAKQWLCLYYRKTSEWNSTMYIADTIIPWTSEWLLHYECWVSTGNWNGGGIHS